MHSSHNSHTRPWSKRGATFNPGPNLKKQTKSMLEEQALNMNADKPSKANKENVDEGPDYFHKVFAQF